MYPTHVPLLLRMDVRVVSSLFAVINRASVESVVFVCGAHADSGWKAGSPHSACICVNEIQVGIFSPRHPGQEPGFLLKGFQGSGQVQGSWLKQPAPTGEQDS